MKLESPVWRDVFYNFKDTRLFIDVMKSTTAIHSSSTENTPSELIRSVESIQKFITFHTSNYKLMKCKCMKKDVQERNIEVKRRQHAVLFFSILKSLKITSSEADAYFETVHLAEPCNIIWYFDLLCHLHWHECFIHCAKQLPDNIMLYVCKQFLTLESEHRSFSLYYVIMQSIIWKLFILEDPQITTQKEQSPIFSFPFMLPDDSAPENTSEQLIELYKLVLQKSEALAKPEQSKLLLHAMKLIFKILLKVKTFEGIFVKDLIGLTALHISYDLSNGVQNSFYDCEVQDSVYREESAGISLECLILTICSYSDELEELIAQEDSCVSKISPDLDNLLSKAKEIIKNSFLSQKQLEEKQEILALLEAVIQNNYPCSLKAAEIIIKQPTIASSFRFIEVLNDNRKVLENERNLKFLLNAAFMQEENKEPLIALLFNALSNVPEAVYYNFLNYRITNFGCQTELKHPTFSDQIAQFGRKTLNYEEAEKIILPLLVQSPYVVLSTIIAQALDQGKKGMDLIKVLTNVASLTYSSNPNLLTEISSYFSSEEENHVKMLKNIPLLIETIVKNGPEDLFEEFMEICILPRLDVSERLEFVLNCLLVALQNLIDNERRYISRQLLFKYLEKCGALLNDCIVSHRSKTKELVIEGVSMMRQLFPRVLRDEDVTHLSISFQEYTPIILIYMNDFLGHSVYEILEKPSVSLSELMWTWCCFTNDQETLQKCILQPDFSHKELQKVLYSGLPHFTLEEWYRSCSFIEISCKHLHKFLASNQKPWKLNESNFRIYATVKCLMDCVSSVLMKEDGSCSNACSNFTNTVMKLLDAAATQPECFLYIFMDMCVFSDAKYFWKNFSSFLIALLKKTYEYCKDEPQKKVFQSLFTNILKRLPESDDKLAILNAV